jgi:hypothetical protein
MSEKILDYLNFNIATSKEIQINTGINQMGVSRYLRSLGDKVIKIPNGKSPKYALTTNAFGVGDRIYVWEVDNFGKTSAIAALRPLATGGFFVENKIQMPDVLMPSVFLGEKGNGLYDDLPYFLRDMAPKGFLGRKVAEHLANLDDSFPKNPDNWQNEHTCKYLLTNTENSTGNLKFGNNANLNLRPQFATHSRSQYLDISNNVIDNDEVLSSAGGEQAKFTTFCTDINHHVIVKFSPRGDSENARRWKDILITEHYANQVINNSGILTAANTELLEYGDRLFLESKRFDRPSKDGRRSMLSLQMIDAEFVGNGNSWLKSATNLHTQQLLTYQDLINVESLAVFAKLINNTDTHLGNISFETHNSGFSLLPIYDMCSMGFAPKNGGDVLPFQFKQPEIKTENNVDLNLIRKMVFDFWKFVANDEKTSIEFKEFIYNDILLHYGDVEYQQNIRDIK